MRVSTGMIFDAGVSSMQQRQQDTLKTQQQISSGTRILRPADDPVAATAILGLTQAQGIGAQFRLNADSAMESLASSEQALADATRVLQDLKALAVSSGNAALNDDNRRSMAAEATGLYEELLSIANRTDGTGRYLFSGFQDGTQPFVQSAPGTVSYAGDQGRREMQVSASRSISASEPGNSVFMDIREGNGVFATAPATATPNSGSGVIGPGSVLDAAKWNANGNPRDFSVVFHVDGSVTPAVTTYDVVDNVNNISLLTGAAPAAGPYLRPYTPGAEISLARQAPPDTNPAAFDYGALVAISGAPKSGDSFTIKASSPQDVFSTAHDLAAALTAGSGNNDTSRADYQNRLNAVMSNLDRSLDQVLTVRASTGARMREAEAAKGASESVDLQYAKRLSELRDLDYAKALSDLAQQQFYLEAAQKSFKEISGSVLFNYL